MKLTTINSDSATTIEINSTEVNSTEVNSTTRLPDDTSVQAFQSQLSKNTDNEKRVLEAGDYQRLIKVPLEEQSSLSSEDQEKWLLASTIKWSSMQILKNGIKPNIDEN